MENSEESPCSFQKDPYGQVMFTHRPENPAGRETERQECILGRGQVGSVDGQSEEALREPVNKDNALGYYGVDQIS